MTKVTRLDLTENQRTDLRQVIFALKKFRDKYDGDTVKSDGIEMPLDRTILLNCDSALFILDRVCEQSAMYARHRARSNVNNMNPSPRSMMSITNSTKAIFVSDLSEHDIILLRYVISSFVLAVPDLARNIENAPLSSSKVCEPSLDRKNQLSDYAILRSEILSNSTIALLNQRVSERGRVR